MGGCGMEDGRGDGGEGGIREGGDRLGGCWIWRLGIQGLWLWRISEERSCCFDYRWNVSH